MYFRKTMAFPHYDNTIHALRVHLQLRSRAWRGHRRGVQPHSFTLGRAPEKFRKGFINKEEHIHVTFLQPHFAI
jgi:hypothetical protein